MTIVVGTAGHIDHGKTALVRALTGVDTDRLPIEKARGITTELGFARLELAGAPPAALIDVPGHERFIKSMVAGATGIDVVCLAIACDAGVMPQTREHLEICELLGVRSGLVALTKCDLVADDWLALVTAEVAQLCAGTFLAGAPIVPCTVRRPDGCDALRSALAALLAATPPRAPAGVFRLPIDRVFTLAGFGTVVTGTIASGAVARGDELVALAGGRATRARGIQVHDRDVEHAVAGQRAAINVAQLGVDEVARGDVLAHPGAVPISHILDVTYRHLAPAPLSRRQRVVLHHGTAQLPATLVLVEPPVAQLRLDAATPLAALPGDRFVVRIPTATGLRTAGGGTIVRVVAPKARDAATHARTVAALIDAGIERRIATVLEASAATGLAITELARRLGLQAAQLAPAVAALTGTGEVLLAGEHLHHARAVAELERAIIDRAKTPIARETLRTQLSAQLPARTYEAIVDHLVARGALVVTGDLVAHPGTARPALSSAELAVLATFEQARFQPPAPAADTRPVIERLVARGELVRVKPELFFHARAIAELRARLVEFLTRHQTIDAQQWKDLTASSRKYTIALAEYFDAERVTLRVGDVRRLRRSTTS